MECGLLERTREWIEGPVERRARGEANTRARTSARQDVGRERASAVVEGVPSAALPTRRRSGDAPPS
jgi:hypothetical protein